MFAALFTSLHPGPSSLNQKTGLVPQPLLQFSLFQQEYHSYKRKIITKDYSHHHNDRDPNVPQVSR